MPHKKPAIRVLIAERAVSVADAIARNLRSEGCAITGIATSGEQALEAAIITVPDVVFLDLSLPGQMDSLTVGQTIVQDLNCPVVYMATNQQPKAIARIHHTNPSGCLIKPFNLCGSNSPQLAASVKHSVPRALLSGAERIACEA